MAHPYRADHVGSLLRPKNLLDARPMRSLGSSSYSLYLTHLPVVALCYFALKRFELGAAVQMLVMTAVSFPISIAAAYGFYWVFERRFVNRPAVLALKPS